MSLVKLLASQEVNFCSSQEFYWNSDNSLKISTSGLCLMALKYFEKLEGPERASLSNFFKDSLALESFGFRLISLQNSGFCGPLLT